MTLFDSIGMLLFDTVFKKYDVWIFIEKIDEKRWKAKTVISMNSRNKYYALKPERDIGIHIMVGNKC